MAESQKELVFGRLITKHKTVFFVYLSYLISPSG